MTSNDESIQRIITEKLGDMGFSESRNKPGLFWKSTPSAKLFVDMRGGRTRFYGFTKPEDHELSGEEHDTHFRRIKQSLAAVGMDSLEAFETQEPKTCPHCGGKIQ